MSARAGYIASRIVGTVLVVGLGVVANIFRVQVAAADGDGDALSVASWTYSITLLIGCGSLGIYMWWLERLRRKARQALSVLAWRTPELVREIDPETTKRWGWFILAGIENGSVEFVSKDGSAISIATDGVVRTAAPYGGSHLPALGFGPSGRLSMLVSRTGWGILWPTSEEGLDRLISAASNTPHP
jgi:hypothetical protein